MAAKPVSRHVVRHDEGIGGVLGVGDRLEVDVADPAVQLFGPAEELIPHAEVEREPVRQAPVIGQEPVEILESEALVGDTELRVAFGAETAKELREVVELLELRRLFLRQVRVELVPPVLATELGRSAVRWSR